MRWLAVVLALCATQAQALSCLKPDVVRTYKEVDASPDRWGAAVGRLDFDESQLPEAPQSDPNAAPPQTPVRAQLVGKTLDSDGFTKPFQGNVTLMVQCYGPWCAQPQSGQEYLVFLKREPNRHVAFADPCGTRLFANPSREDLDRITTCFRNGPCAEQGLP